MLTISQVETVAFQTEGDIICTACAVEGFGPMAVAAAEQGYANGSEISPLSRYSFDEYASESLWEYLAQEHEGEKLQEEFDKAVSQGYPCGRCGKEIN